jgi:hypothetical protein
VKALKVVLIVFGVILVVFVPPVLPLWLGVIALRRRRRGEPAQPRLAFLSRLGRLALLTVGWVGLILVTITAFAASVSTSTDEHAAPVLGVFVIFATVLIVAADLAIQGILGAGRHALRAAQRP